MKFELKNDRLYKELFNKIPRDQGLIVRQYEELERGTTIVAKEGVGAFVTEKNSISGVFNISGIKNAAKEAIKIAIELGANELRAFQCFEDYYKKLGFETVDRWEFGEKEYPYYKKEQNELLKGRTVISMKLKNFLN